MKKTLISLVFVLCFMQSFSQFTKDSTNAQYDYYMLKNIHQKTTGWVLLGGGLASLFLGGSMAAGYAPGGIGSEGSVVGPALAVAGFGAMVASIPVFISAGKNKRKAAALSFTNQSLLFLPQKDFAMKMQPAITLKISL